MKRRLRGHGNFFDDSEPEESLPEFDVFIHKPAGRLRPTALRYRVLRAGTPRTYRTPFATSRALLVRATSRVAPGAALGTRPVRPTRPLRRTRRQ